MKATFAAVLFVLAGIVCLVCQFALDSAPLFRGELRVAKGQTASIAVQPTNADRSIRPDDTETQRYAVPATEIPFGDPALAGQWLNPQLLYDFIVLPFQLRLTKVDIVTPGIVTSFLDVEAPGAPEPTPKTVLTLGESVHVGNRDVRVDAIRPWAGLLRHPAGGPSASAAVRSSSGAWIENLLLEKDSWLYAGNDLAIHLVWHDSESSARTAAEAGAAPVASARWGVVDGGAINWRESLIPGSGVQLSSGVTVTLREVDPKHVSASGSSFAILLQIDDAGTSKQEWIAANNSDPNALYRLDYPAARDTVFVLHAARDGACIASAYSRRRFVGANALREGEMWTPAGAQYALRVDQVLSTGIPISAEQSSIDEVVLIAEDRVIRIREGESVSLGDDQLRFVQDIVPPRVRYEIGVVHRDAAAGEYTVTLGPGETITTGGVTLGQGAVDPKKPDLAAVTVTIPGSARLGGAGAVLVAAGVIVFGLARRRSRRA